MITEKTKTLKESILKKQSIIERSTLYVEDLILNENVDDDTIREAIENLELHKGEFISFVAKIKIEEWEELLK